MKIQNTRQIISGLLIAGLLGTVFTACSKDDDPIDAKANVKFTITVNGADSNDQVDFIVQAGNHDASQYGNPVWKMNGAEQGTENTVEIDVNNFTGNTKTYVFETVKPFNFSSLHVAVSNFDGAPLSVSYKAEVGGNVETNESKSVVAGQNLIKDYSYKAK
ncbi:hypothetical protein EGY05_22445 [Chryseobacterium arthrosphaerae]|uniref:DUF4625 domain-containing protein n=1 Tax=Chryseobacterium arthrosphaerae TaxID=651561 RepID=A0A3S0QWY8_9FLAO|nr:hypothetical protein [Chryseobacterium arthrosphaerae]AYZ14512.1 hypothetical protein EGY05_22445 [Chryseobacterium arthrosphaerae]RTZ50390.1 hypothetical protein EJ377_11420 [Chryseobacterium arthrosphaerae]